jgi:hypothetical protein
VGRDAIVNLGGFNVLVGGDPDYEDIVIGTVDPVTGEPVIQNQLLDPTADIPVSQLILDTFGIPYSLSNLLGGKLPGLDIRNQDATTMMKLSLATELLDPPEGSAGFAEVELDAFGIARFYIAGETAASNLDIRYCVPTSQITTPADLVVVRGYDPPPKRELRDSFDGLKNKEIMDYKDCAEESCDEDIVSQYATISYDDPQLDQNYLDDIVNSYELQAFETILGYLIDLDMPDGTDPSSSSFVPGLKVTFGDSTKEYIKVAANLFNASVVGGTITDEDGQITTIGNQSRGGSESATAGTDSAVSVVLTTVSPRGDKCSITQTAIAGSNITISSERFKRLNKFGREESDFIGVVDVVFSGRKVQSLTVSPGSPSFGVDGLVKTVVRPNKELVSLQQGKNWSYTVDPSTLDVTISLYSIIEDAFTEYVCSTYGDPISATGNPNTDVVTFTSDNLFTSEETLADMDDFICNIGDSLGYRTTNAQICLVVERKRPSIDIFDPLGNALSRANEISITYTPIVIVDEPAPIAYAATSNLTSIDGTTALASEGIIDQADGIVDSDPSTVQDLGDSETSILQDNTSGSTIDITLPFCTDQECLQIARNFLDLQDRTVSTHSMILGPDSQPRLGDFVNLPNAETGVLNEINYSYTDSSQYLITATVGPLYLSAGSFNDSKYQLQTEDVTREGIVVQDGGNGAEYVVRIEGYGEITALLMVLDDVSVGDKVGVRIYNNPVEKI